MAYRVDVRYRKACAPFASAVRATEAGARKYAADWIREAKHCGYQAEAILTPLAEMVVAEEEETHGRRLRSEYVAERRRRVLDELARRGLCIAERKLPQLEIALTLDIPYGMVEDDICALRRKARLEARARRAGPRVVEARG
jgi:hypothetical protein